MFAADSEYPGRKVYVGTPYIELKQLGEQFNEVVIVDVRSNYEFKTLHIKTARNIPLGPKNFVNDMRALRKQYPDNKIVTYCNGKTCMKSYKAASKGIENVVAFDASIMDWAKANPDRSVLLDVLPIDPGRLISKKDFTSKLLGPEDFF